MLDTCLPSIAQASLARASERALPKSYAVFLATYDPATGSAVGGVAGSAFFVSPTEAITAFHVLQPKSFANPRTQVWLVHEGEPAIELQAAELVSEAHLDRTTVRLKTTRARLVYQVDQKRSNSPHDNLALAAKIAVPEAKADSMMKVMTDGFRANSTGPELAPRADGRLAITNVPHLERLHAEGTLLRKQAVDLISQDVNLQAAPCLQLSYTPIVGLSGGPVTSADGQVIGMNSFADPEARASTWAVSVTK